VLVLRGGGAGLNPDGQAVRIVVLHVVRLDVECGRPVEMQATDRAFRIGQNEECAGSRHSVALSRCDLEEKIDQLMNERQLSISFLMGCVRGN